MATTDISLGRIRRKVWRLRQPLGPSHGLFEMIPTALRSKLIWVQHWALMVEHSQRVFELDINKRNWSATWIFQKAPSQFSKAEFKYLGETDKTDQEILETGIFLLDPFAHYSLPFNNCQVVVTDIARQILLPGHEKLPEPWFTEYWRRTSEKTMIPLMSAFARTPEKKREAEQFVEIIGPFVDMQFSQMKRLYGTMSKPGTKFKGDLMQGRGLEGLRNAWHGAEDELDHTMEVYLHDMCKLSQAYDEEPMDFTWAQAQEKMKDSFRASVSIKAMHGLLTGMVVMNGTTRTLFSPISSKFKGQTSPSPMRGNFTASSSNIRLEGLFMLIADCQSLAGPQRPSQLDLNKYLTNNHGLLQWKKDGNFKANSRKIELKDDGRVLEAEVYDGESKWLWSWIRLDEMISNHDGRLVYAGAE